MNLEQIKNRAYGLSAQTNSLHRNLMRIKKRLGTLRNVPPTNADEIQIKEVSNDEADENLIDTLTYLHNSIAFDLKNCHELLTALEEDLWECEVDKDGANHITDAKPMFKTSRGMMYHG